MVAFARVQMSLFHPPITKSSTQALNHQIDRFSMHFGPTTHWLLSARGNLVSLVWAGDKDSNEVKQVSLRRFHP